jgi:hypothetical protein
MITNNINVTIAFALGAHVISGGAKHPIAINNSRIQ